MERKPSSFKQIVARIGLVTTASILSACGGKLNIGDTVKIRGSLQEGLTGGRAITTVCEAEEGELFQIDRFGTISHGSAGTETIARVSSQAEVDSTDCAGQSGQVFIGQITQVK